MGVFIQSVREARRSETINEHMVSCSCDAQWNRSCDGSVCAGGAALVPPYIGEAGGQEEMETRQEVVGSPGSSAVVTPLTVAPLVAFGFQRQRKHLADEKINPRGGDLQ